jgi:NhaC family Na+:H+ antiporter
MRVRLDQVEERGVPAAPKEPSLLDSLIPIISLVIFLALSVVLFGTDSSQGANQIALMLCTLIAALVAMKNGYDFKGVSEAMLLGIGAAMGAIFILLAVGALIGAWMMSGTIITIIYYGVQFLSPTYFYVSAVVLCAIVALSIGSSWTTAGTIGVGLIGIAAVLDLSTAITAGAIISGSYFGDKLSPLSETTNLASAVAGVNLFEHIKNMAWTTIPAVLIAMVIFLFIGLNEVPNPEGLDTTVVLETLESEFNITLLTLIPLVVVVAMALKRYPAYPTIIIGALVGCLTAVILQPNVVLSFVNDPSLGTPIAMLKGVWMVLFDGYVSNTGYEGLDDLLTRGGMSSMLITVWLIIAAMGYGAVLEHAGMLNRLIQPVLRAAKGTGRLILAVIGTCFTMNIVTADQYIAIVLPGRTFKAEFESRHLEGRVLSRALEDGGTITSPLVPWNTCGAYMAATLGIATAAYVPYAFFNLINPLVGILYGFTGFKVAYQDENGSGEVVSADRSEDSEANVYGETNGPPLAGDDDADSDG